MALRYDPTTMSTGVLEVDEQHEELIEHLNALIEKMMAGRGQEELGPLLDFLADYTQRHFSHEEGCMARYRCPAAAANKAAHQQFLATLASFQEDLRDQGPTVSLVLRAQQELGEWVRNHIMRTDIQLRECVRGVV